MLFSYICLLVGLAGLGISRPPPESYQPLTTNHGRFPENILQASPKNQRRSMIVRKDASSCNPAQENSIKAPKANIFQGLTDDEAAAVTSFLHDQPKLNLTAGSNATK